MSIDHSGLEGINLPQIPQLHTGAGVSKEDYVLGEYGAKVGGRIKFWGTAIKKEHLFNWLCTALSE